MRCGKLAVFLAALTVVVVARESAAMGGSRFSIRADFGVRSYPSDESLKTEYFPARGSDPIDCRGEGQMTYHFDRKFGLSGHGALCWRAHPNVEIELGAGYTSMQLEITQHGLSRVAGACWADPDAIGIYDYDTQKGADVSYVNVRPAVNLTLSRKARIVPYLSIGLDILKIGATADLDFLLLAVEGQGTTHYLSDSTGAVRLDGSDWAFGLDIGSGLEIRLWRAFSMTFGFAYTFQFGKAFPEFDELITADSDATARSARYYNEGMATRNIGAMVGFKLYL